MRILVFTEGTILMHASAVGLSRDEIVDQVQGGQAGASVSDHASYLPVGGAVDKLQTWKRQGAKIAYLTSRTKPKEIDDIRNVLKRYDFPRGELFFRQEGERYENVAERILPDLLIEDDCESIGGEVEMISPHIKLELRERIKAVAVREFGGIDHLPDDIADQSRWTTIPRRADLTQ